MNTRNYLIAAVCVSVLVTACSDDSNDTDSNGTLTWRTCSEAPEIECATLNVPMTYSRTESETQSIGLARLPTGSDTATEALLINPGGSGASGNNLLELFSQKNTISEKANLDYS